MVSKSKVFPSTLFQENKLKCVKAIIGEYTYIGRVIGYTTAPNTAYKLIFGVTRAFWKNNEISVLNHPVSDMRSHREWCDNKESAYMLSKPKQLYPCTMACLLSEVIK